MGVDIEIIEDKDPDGHKFKRLDTSEMLLARILQRQDNQDRKIVRLERLLKEIARRV
jgi:hypothetical protein